jgi:LPS-assembly lipoprotein
MSSSRRIRTGIAGAGLLAALLALAGCQVQPLYGANASGGSVASAAISISPATSRVGQVVRNDLVFAFGQGSGEPANAAYRLDLTVSSAAIGVLPTGLQNDFSAGRLTATAVYKLVDTASGTLVHAGKRDAIALLDYPAQGYSNVRAVRDAENRAARELAALVRADVAASLARQAR